MPRPGPRKDLVFVRLAPATVAELQRLADAEGITRSEMIRQLLTDALAARRST